MNKAIVKYIFPASLTLTLLSVLSGCVTQSFENNEPIVKTQANRDEMAATRVSLGLGYLRMGDMPQAKLNLEKAKKFSPELVQVHTAFAHYYETVGEAALAKKSFQQALVLKSDSADTLNNYGVFLCRQGQIEEAEVQFLKAIAVPTYLMVSQSYENLSSCYLQNDDFAKAEMYLNKAIFHDPNRTATLLQMVRIQYAMGNYKEAERYLQKFERNTQRFSPDSLSLAYKLYWKLGQRRTANNYANMLVKMYPQSWEGEQYLLNELSIISADELATRYQLINKRTDTELISSSGKRVVKLSPKKADDMGFTQSNKLYGVQPKTATVSTEAITATAVTESAMAAPKLAPTLVSTTTSPVTGAGAVVISGTAAVTNAVVKNTANATSSEEPTTIMAKESDVEMVTASQITEEIPAAESETVIATQAIANNVESNSTQPVAATRDVALPEPIDTPFIEILPEAIAQPIADKVAVTGGAVAEQEIVKEAEEVVSEQVPDTTAESIAALSDTTVEPNLKTIDESVVITEEVTLAEQAVTTEAITDKADKADRADMVDMVDIADAIHTVQSGENLYNISVKHNIKLQTLRNWNAISDNNKIRIGDKLYVVDPSTVKND